MTGLFAALRARKLMLAAIACGVLCGLLLPDAGGAVTRALIGWNAGVWLYLALVAHWMIRADHDRMMRTAAAHAEGAVVVLGVVVLAALMSVVGIVVEVSAAKGGGTRTALPHLLFALSTVACSWVLLPTLFTQIYASLYYFPEKQSTAGLRFPAAEPVGEPPFQPDYGDFAYFAFTVAVASQTSDVVVDTRSMRRLVLVQSVLSFVFNTTILALTINLAASLF